MLWFNPKKQKLLKERCGQGNKPFELPKFLRHVKKGAFVTFYHYHFNNISKCQKPPFIQWCTFQCLPQLASLFINVLRKYVFAVMPLNTNIFLRGLGGCQFMASKSIVSLSLIDGILVHGKSHHFVSFYIRVASMLRRAKYRQYGLKPVCSLNFITHFGQNCGMT